MAPTPLDLINKAEGQSLGSIIVNGLGGTLLALWIGGINVIQAIASVFFLPLEALGIESADVVSAFLGSIGDLFVTGARTAQQSILPGQPWAVGPFTFALAGLAIGAAIFVVSNILERSETSNLVPGSGTDYPLVGRDEGQEDSED